MLQQAIEWYERAVARVGVDESGSILAKLQFKGAWQQLDKLIDYLF